MSVKSQRKELLSFGLDSSEADLLRFYANTLRRSVSETIRLIIEEHFDRNKNLKDKYSAR